MVAKVFAFGCCALIVATLSVVSPSLAQEADQPVVAPPTSAASPLSDQERENGPAEVSTHSELVDSVNSMDRVLRGQPDPSEVVRQRLIAVGLIVGMVLALLGTLFGYLRMDHATRGFHSGRLQMMALGVVGLILIAGYFLWTQLLFK